MIWKKGFDMNLIFSREIQFFNLHLNVEKIKIIISLHISGRLFESHFRISSDAGLLSLGNPQNSPRLYTFTSHKFTHTQEWTRSTSWKSVAETPDRINFSNSSPIFSFLMLCSFLFVSVLYIYIYIYVHIYRNSHTTRQLLNYKCWKMATDRNRLKHTNLVCHLVLLKFYVEAFSDKSNLNNIKKKLHFFIT